jgi:hypothetical protein
LPVERDARGLELLGELREVALARGADTATPGRRPTHEAIASVSARPSAMPMIGSLSMSVRNTEEGRPELLPFTERIFGSFAGLAAPAQLDAARVADDVGQQHAIR